MGGFRFTEALKDATVDAAAGTVGGASAIAAGNPFDLIKVRLQNGNFRGPLHCAVKTVRAEGFFALYKGSYPALISSLTENSVVWSVNAVLRNAVIDRQEEAISSNQHAVLGAMTGIVSSIAICPAEVLKVKQQVMQDKKPLSTFDVARRVYRHSGIRGFYQGLTPLMLRDVPFYFLFFYGMETYFHWVESSDSSSRTSLLHSAVGGGVAGSFAWSVIFPLDVIKSRMQAGRNDMIGFGPSVLRIVQNEGVSSLYRGWLPAVIRGWIANGALVFGVHATKTLFAENHQ